MADSCGAFDGVAGGVRDREGFMFLGFAQSDGRIEPWNSGGRSREVPGEPGSLLEGMVLGDRSRNLPLFSSVMTTSSLLHLTAVSGKKI